MVCLLLSVTYELFYIYTFIVHDKFTVCFKIVYW